MNRKGVEFSLQQVEPDFVEVAISNRENRDEREDTLTAYGHGGLQSSTADRPRTQ